MKRTISFQCFSKELASQLSSLFHLGSLKRCHPKCAINLYKNSEGISSINLPGIPKYTFQGSQWFFLINLMNLLNMFSQKFTTHFKRNWWKNLPQISYWNQETLRESLGEFSNYLWKIIKGVMAVKYVLNEFLWIFWEIAEKIWRIAEKMYSWSNF